MKTKLLIGLLLISSFVFGQDSLKVKSSFFTVNPNQNVIKNTNGINVGILDDYKKQRINGINIQANPITLLYLLIPKGIEVPKKGQETVVINGLHISTGGMMNGKKLNGIGVSMYHIAQETNGISFNGFNNNSGKLNGLHVSWLNNSADSGNGAMVAFSNDAEKFNGLQTGVYNYNGKGKGLQVGASNKSESFNGLQIGVINKNKNGKAVQIGLWNVNERRKLPIINWNFKAKKS
ncbi:LA_2272 family surface repeat-containing protein [Chryseobacterium sp. SIMBA_038]|uniref:LA_2272 family surface repeat-containing protein n=1 Tax=Chryseobacterium sp. SIMBA_038 TaxID=3085780 RepID=UPI00397CB156